MAAATNNEFKLLSHQYTRVQLGSAVTFSCRLFPEISAVDMEIRWFKGTDCVCLYKTRRMTEGRGYKGRVSLFTQELDKGNISIQLSETRESDIGHYLCHVTDGESTGKLTVRLWWPSLHTRGFTPQGSRCLVVTLSKIRSGLEEEIREDYFVKVLMTEDRQNPLQSLRRVFQCGVIPYVNIQEWGKKWTEEEKMKMEESSLLTEYDTDVKSIMRELIKKQNTLEETEEQLKNTKLNLNGATRDLEDSTDPDSSGSVSKLVPPVMGAASLSSDSSQLRLVLLGRTGSGKSAAGNTILGRAERNQDVTYLSTQQSEGTQGEVAGRMVSVVDTPDWFSPGLSLEKVRQDVEHCVRLSAPGPHVFLLVIPVKQPTGEERGMLEKMEEILGERCWRNTMILFTVTDELQKKNIEEFIQSADQEVPRLVEKCGNRFHCLNIKESGDGSQVSELLEKIEKMLEGSMEKFYSSEIYLETESQLEKMIMLAKERKIGKEGREMEVKLEQEFQNSLKKIEGMIQEHESDITQLSSQIAGLEGKLTEEMDEVKKEKMQRELEEEVNKKAKIENIIMILNEKIEWERKEMKESLRQKVEEIRNEYEREAGMEAERNLMKIMLPEIQRNHVTSKSKMEEEFRRQMEEKDRELELLKQTLTQLREATQESMLGKESQEESGEIGSQNRCRKRGGSM